MLMGAYLQLLVNLLMKNKKDQRLSADRQLRIKIKTIKQIKNTDVIPAKAGIQFL